VHHGFGSEESCPPGLKRLRSAIADRGTTALFQEMLEVCGELSGHVEQGQSQLLVSDPMTPPAVSYGPKRHVSVLVSQQWFCICQLCNHMIASMVFVTLTENVPASGSHSELRRLMSDVESIQGLESSQDQNQTQIMRTTGIISAVLQQVNSKSDRCNHYAVARHKTR